MENDVRLITFYLPQFHPIPENDEWWGKGFTEWTNVANAIPRFPGHYQPHIPADLGFYDLRLAETREAQAALAREYGIHGFCYYHYWFNGRRILEQPFNEVLKSGRPGFPFCLCWANENWTRTWDGGDQHVLLEQNYSHEDDLTHIQSLLPAFRDKRYIKINGRPLFLVYRTELLPDPYKTTQIWRQAAKDAGITNLYLVRVENFTKEGDPRSIGFDASVEFAPDHANVGKLKFQGKLYTFLVKLGVLPPSTIENSVANYRAMVNGVLKRQDPEFIRFHCVTPSWDNSPRREKKAWIYTGSSPELFGVWLKEAIRKTKNKFTNEEKIIFINAWNEWAEGCHLEPDLKWGRAYLEATRDALTHSTDYNVKPEEFSSNTPSSLKRLYWKIVSVLGEIRGVSK